MLKEFREFAMRGNVVDLAVGVIIGAAFGKITTSLVNDVIMPLIGVLLGKVDFSNLFFTLSDGSFTSVTAVLQASKPRAMRACRWSPMACSLTPSSTSPLLPSPCLLSSSR